MAALNLRNIDWPSALAELRRQATSPERRRRFARASSLAARFARGFDEGARSIADAARAEPLDPLHRVRFALHCLRYGLHERALATLDTLGPAKDQASARTVRALATLQSGEDRRAANIARDVHAADPGSINAAFLEADANLRHHLKDAETRTQSIPRDPAWATAWTHLLVKRIVARPRDSAKVTKQHLEVRPVLTKGSAHEQLVRRAAGWSSAPRSELASTVTSVKAGSRAEELVLSLLAEQLREESSNHASSAESSESGLRELDALYRANADRPAVRRIYVATLTRAAIEHAASERWGAALRAIEVAGRLEPHEPVHLQNRAAVLTAMADDAQHDAWADLDRLHYRLALSGCLDAETARRIAKPHRMFAEQARLTPTNAALPTSDAPSTEPARASWGVFCVKEETEDGTTTRTLEVNQKRLDDDPEELRQWIHHRRAEVVFRHIALGHEPQRLLLAPADARTQRARIRALVISSESLATLVPEEGRVLADSLARGFRALPAGRTQYARVTTVDDAATSSLKLQYAETIADLAVISWTWGADPRRADIVDELIDTIDAMVPFLEESALTALLSPDRAGELTNVRFLNALIRQTLDVKDGALVLTDALRARLAARLAAELLVTLATRRLDASPSLPRPEIERALGIVDRARQRDPDYARVEYIAARILTIGEFYDEARTRMERFFRISGGKDSPHQQGIEEIQRILDEKKKANVAGNARAASSSGGTSSARRDEDDAAAGPSRAERLEVEIERFPTSVQLYEELARALCKEGRFDVARSWATRAMGRCLTRKAQLRARVLELEVIGLELLAPKHFDAVEVYLAGSHGAALVAVDAAIAAIDRGEPAPYAPPPHYALHYLRGMCLLARRERDGAEKAFKTALEACPQQRSRAALKPLAENVEQALLDQSRATVESALAAGKLRDAMREVTSAITGARAPEACLLDLARVQLAEAVDAVAHATSAGGVTPNEPAPTLTLDETRAPWRNRLTRALEETTAVKRAHAVAKLAEELHEASRNEAAVLLRRIDAFMAELGFADSVAEATRLERRGELLPALSVLDVAGERAKSDPRALRLRIMLLLRLDRFEEADQSLAILEASGHASARSLVDKYPDLRFKFAHGAATRMLRANDLDAAHAILVALRPTTPDAEMEHAYSLAFCLARLARARLDAGQRDEAIAKMTAALDILESKLAAAGGALAAARSRFEELRDRLDTDLSHMQAV